HHQRDPRGGPGRVEGVEPAVAGPVRGSGLGSSSMGSMGAAARNRMIAAGGVVRPRDDAAEGGARGARTRSGRKCLKTVIIRDRRCLAIRPGLRGFVKMLSLQTIFGRGMQFYSLLDDAA